MGNPSDAALAVASSDRTRYDSASVGLASVRFTGCDGSEDVDDLGATLDLLAGEAVRVPVGQLCQVDLLTSSPMILEGATDTDGELHLLLDLGEVPIPVSSLLVTGKPLVIELGEPDWLSASTLDLGDGEDLDVQPGDARHEALVAVVLASSSIYEGEASVDPTGDDTGDDHEEDRSSSGDQSSGESDDSDTADTSDTADAETETETETETDTAADTED